MRMSRSLCLWLEAANETVVSRSVWISSHRTWSFRFSLLRLGDSGVRDPAEENSHGQVLRPRTTVTYEEAQRCAWHTAE